MVPNLIVLFIGSVFVIFYLRFFSFRFLIMFSYNNFNPLYRSITMIFASFFLSRTKNGIFFINLKIGNKSSNYTNELGP